MNSYERGIPSRASTMAKACHAFRSVAVHSLDQMLMGQRSTNEAVLS